MKKYLLILVSIISILGLVSCGQGSTQEPKVTPPAPPEKGQATIIGKVISSQSRQPIEDSIVRLADIVRQGDEGAYILDNAFSPGARTDHEGYFIFENIPPKEYVIIIGDVYDKYAVITGDDKKPKAWNAVSDQVLDVGELRVDITQ